MENGFERSLLELAKTHDNKAGLWLTTIESDVMNTLRGSLATTAGVSADAEPVVAAAQQLEKFFRDFRNSLEKE